MSDYAVSLKRISSLFAVLAFTALLLVVNIPSLFGKASAADLTARSLTLSSTLAGSENNGDPGSATNGAAADHTFTFTVPSTGPAATTTFTYCTTAIGAGTGGTDNGCTKPTGLVLPASPTASAGSAAGSNNRITWTQSIGASTQTVTFEGITNPTSVGSFFVRIATSAGDDGTVASAITEGIEITARVAETLGFSTTGTIDTTNVMDPTAACLPLTGSGAITLGDPTENTLALTQAYDNYSAFRIYTNAAGGVDVQYTGDTLRKGTDPTDPDIDEIGGTEAASTPGTGEQFGLAIDTVNGGDGADTPVTVTSSSTALDFDFIDSSTNLGANGPLVPQTNYTTGAGTITSGGTARFSFVPDTPTTIAASTGYVECKTAAVRYIANVSPTTTSGTYTTTIVYSAVPKY